MRQLNRQIRLKKIVIIGTNEFYKQYPERAGKKMYLYSITKDGFFRVKVGGNNYINTYSPKWFK